MDMTTVDIITQVIGNLGFPIFVALYVMVTLNKQMQAMDKSLNDLAIAIQRMSDLLIIGSGNSEQ